MARPRKQIHADTNLIDHADAAALDEAGHAMTLHAQRVALVVEEYDAGMPYDQERYIARARDLVIETGARMVELGLILLQLREREPHADFLHALERIGIVPRFAQRAMQAAIKMRDRPRIADLGVTKMLELVTEDDDTLAGLESGETIAGLTLDDIDRMSVRELKERLRKARADAIEEKAGTDELVAKRDDRIRKLERERNRLAKGSAQVKAEDLVQQLCAAAIEVERAARAMVDIAGEIEHVHDEAGEQIEEGIQQVIERQIEFATTALNDLLAVVGE